MNHKLKSHIDISKKDHVESTSGVKVSSVTWDPTKGLARKEQIAQAREEAFQAHQEYLKSLTPEEQRLRSIEARLDALEGNAK